MGIGHIWLTWVGNLWPKWVGHYGLKWVGHLWVKWMGHLFFSGDAKQIGGGVDRWSYCIIN